MGTFVEESVDREQTDLPEKLGFLRQVATGRISVLEPEHLVGRSSLCALQLNEAYVSAQHATFRWTGHQWELRDLGSRNGTFLDDTRLRRTEAYQVKRGMVVAFGQQDQRWEICADDPPVAMVVPLGSGSPLVMDGEILAIPSPDDPQATIFRGAEGIWCLERPDEAIVGVHNQSTFEVAGRAYRFSCPTLVARTATCEQSREIQHISLRFSVSLDEEHVHLDGESGGKAFDLGTRAHHYLLLTLARHRLSENDMQLPETSRGWIYQDELLKLLAISATQLNIDIFRIRKQFTSLGVLDAPNVIERRPRTRQLRLGVNAVTIRKI